MAKEKKVSSENEDESTVLPEDKPKNGKSKDLSENYNRFKRYHGKEYTGMQIGRGHHWHYDEGDWKETKITPDLWEISYAVTKRRVGKAPENSGVPVGTGYQWYILAHQKVVKLNANAYSTDLTGLKFKLAHKRADKDKWSAKAPTQRKHLIRFLKDIIDQLEKEPIPIQFDFKGKTYKGEAVPIAATCSEDVCYEADVTLTTKISASYVVRKAVGNWIVPTPGSPS